MKISVICSVLCVSLFAAAFAEQADLSIERLTSFIIDGMAEYDEDNGSFEVEIPKLLKQHFGFDLPDDMTAANHTMSATADTKATSDITYNDEKHKNVKLSESVTRKDSIEGEGQLDADGARGRAHAETEVTKSVKTKNGTVNASVSRSRCVEASIRKARHSDSHEFRDQMHGLKLKHVMAFVHVKCHQSTNVTTHDDKTIHARSEGGMRALVLGRNKKVSTILVKGRSHVSVTDSKDREHNASVFAKAIVVM